MLVTITKKHAATANYDSHDNDALTHAIKDQHPDFDLKKSLCGMVVTNDGEKYESDNSDDTGYNRTTHRRLKSGLIKEIKLKLEKAS